MVLMPDFVVFSFDAEADRVDPVSATSADAPVAQVLAPQPGAITTVLPDEAMEGCNRTLLLREWMGVIKAPKSPQPIS